MNKKNAKKIALALASCAVFASYLVLSLSCATTPKKTYDSGSEVFVSSNETENDFINYDIELVSASPSPLRILKLTKKAESKAVEIDSETEESEAEENEAEEEKFEEPNVLYAISTVGDTEIWQTIKTANGSKKIKVDENLVTTSEILEKTLISEEDAKAAVDFINELENTFKAERSGEAVLRKFEVDKVWSEYKTGTELQRITTAKSNGRASSYLSGSYYSRDSDSSYTEKEEKIVHWWQRHEDRVFFIQHYTVYGKDEILLSVGRYDWKDAYGGSHEQSFEPKVVSLEEILAVRDALSK